MSQPTLPIIDLAPFASGDAAGRAASAEALRRACATHGFFYAAGHGVPAGTIEAALEAMARFFALPMQTKREAIRRPGTYRGYIETQKFADNPDGSEILYEAFILGPDTPEEDDGRLRWPNVWPAAPATFQPALSAYRDALDGVAALLIRAFSEALDQDEAVLAAMFAAPLTNLSFLHYPPRPGDGADSAKGHHDTNAFTILHPSPVGGLEIDRPEGWLPVTPLADCFVVNIGNMMECWSGGRFRSTIHRVHPPRGAHRYSIGYFAAPDAGVVAPPPGLGRAPGYDGPESMDFAAELEAFVAQFDA